jgi:hypothetical protein
MAEGGHSLPPGMCSLFYLNCEGILNSTVLVFLTNSVIATLIWLVRFYW